MKEKIKRILIFGSSFNPVHKVHLELVKKAIEQFQIDQTFLVPTYQSPFVKEDKTNVVHRLNMLRLAMKAVDLKNTKISTYECFQKKISYTINTVIFFKNKFPHEQLFLLIGADHVETFSKWKDAVKIASLTQIICAPRTGYDLSAFNENVQKYHMQLLVTPEKNTKSTKLRIFPTLDELFPSVLDYINQHGLYAKYRLGGLSQERFDHSLRTAQMAKRITLENKLHPLAEKAYVAGLFHDFAKEFPKEEMLKIANENNIHGYAHLKTLHGPVGSVVLQQKHGFNDTEILSAIYYHTEPFLSGHKPSTLDKIIYLADKIEPERKELFQRASYYYEIRRLCFQNLHDGFAKLYEISLKYLVKKQLILKE